MTKTSNPKGKKIIVEFVFCSQFRFSGLCASLLYLIYISFNVTIDFIDMYVCINVWTVACTHMYCLLVE